MCISHSYALCWLGVVDQEVALVDQVQHHGLLPWNLVLVVRYVQQFQCLCDIFYITALFLAGAVYLHVFSAYFQVPHVESNH